MGWLSDITDSLSSRIGGDMGNAIDSYGSGSLDLGGNQLNQYTGGLFNPFAEGGTVNNFFKGDSPPDAPGTDAALAAAQKAQFNNAKNFRKNLPTTQNQMYRQLEQEGTGLLNQNLKGIRSGNSARGLLYGGINAGQEQKARGNMANSLAQGRSGINSQTEEAANVMDQQAVTTAMGIQKSQRAMQDMIYSQALASMQSQNAAFSGTMGLLTGGGAKGMMSSGASAAMA